MADQRSGGIVWTEESWNPIRARWMAPTTDGADIERVERVGWHCEKVSEACRNCYAEAMNKRLGTGLSYSAGNKQLAGDPPNIGVEVFLDEKLLMKPLQWKQPRKIFLSSMTDIFADFVKDEWLDKIFAIMALCPQHTFQVLTKRAARMQKYFSGIEDESGYLIGPELRDALIEGRAQSIHVALHPEPDGDPSEWLAVHMPLPNVWLGVTAENQKAADERILLLLATPAALRWVSVEPMLGPVDLTHIRDLKTGDEINALGNIARTLLTKVEIGGKARNPSVFECETKQPSIDWVVAGGESGKHARPSHPDWFRSLRDQCAAAGVPYLHKQNGEWSALSAFVKSGHSPIEDNTCIRLRPDGTRGIGGWPMQRVGKKAAGRLLDGVLHDAFPEVHHG